MADPTTQAQPVYLRDIRVLRRGPDDIVTGATVVETGAAYQRLHSDENGSNPYAFEVV